MPGDTSRPLRADAERNRRLILDTADRMIARTRTVAPLNEIAREAGLGVGTVYRRFPDVQTLIDTLFTERFARYIDFTTDAGRLDDPGNALRHYLITAATNRAGDPGLDVILANADLTRPEVTGIRDELASRIDGLVASALRAEAVRPDLAGADVYSFLYMLGAVADRTESVTPGAWRRYADVLLTGFGLAPTTPTSAVAMTDDQLRRAWPESP